MEQQEQRFADDLPGGPLKKGPWTAAEDALLMDYVNKHGHCNWNSVQKNSGVSRCGKSCRLRWTNHLRPELKKGVFSPEEERLVVELHAALGNRWARIGTHLQGRTDNDIKNFWNTRAKRLMRAGLPLYPPDLQPIADARENHQQYRSSEQGEGVSVSLSSGADSEGDIVSSRGAAADFTRTFNQVNMKSGLGTISLPGNSATATGGARMNVKTHPMSLHIAGLRARSCTPGIPGLGDLSGTTTSSVLSQAGPSSFQGSPVRRLKRARDSPTAFEGGRQPFQQYSDESISLMQPFLKTRCLYDRNTVRLDAFSQGFPYDPDPAGLKSPSYGFSAGGLGFAAGSSGGSSCSFSLSMSRPIISGLKVELPSVQLAESADSAGTPSSALSSPFASCHTLQGHPLSEVDSFASTNNTNNNGSTCTNDRNNNLLEVLLQQSQSVDPIDPVPLDVADQLLVMTSSNNSPDMARVAVNAQRAHWTADSDPLSLLGGRSLTLFNDDLKATMKSEDSSSNTCTDSPSLVALPAGTDPGVKMKEQLLYSIKTEDQGVGVYHDEELLTLLTFERPDALLDADLYDQSTAVMGATDQEEEVAGQGGLETIFGQEVALDLEQLGSISGISNAWELGSCVWNNMPGALQVGEMPASTDDKPFTSM